MPSFDAALCTTIIHEVLMPGAPLTTRTAGLIRGLATHCTATTTAYKNQFDKLITNKDYTHLAVDGVVAVVLVGVVGEAGVVGAVVVVVVFVHPMHIPLYIRLGS